MRRILMPIMLTLALMGCAGLPSGPLTVQNPITNQRLYAVEQGYKAALRVAVEYRDLYDRNPCPRGAHASLTNICAERPIVEKMQAVVARTRIARKVLDKFVRENPTLDPATPLRNLEDAITAFNAIKAGVPQ